MGIYIFLVVTQKLTATPYSEIGFAKDGTFFQETVNVNRRSIGYKNYIKILTSSFSCELKLTRRFFTTDFWDEVWRKDPSLSLP